MLVQVLRWLQGAVGFHIYGSAERFFNQCARQGIILWDMKSGEEPSAWIMASRYKKLLSCAARSRCRLHIEQRKGLPFRTAWLKKRKGLALGVVLFMVILIGLSQHVWSIKTIGNEEIPAAKLEEVYQKVGLVPGISKKDLDPQAMQRAIMQELPEIAWISVNTKGCSVSVEVAEAVGKPEMENQETPCNIKAAFSGQILRIEVYEGTAVAKVGEAVVEGQLLISGMVEDTNKNVTLIKHASGRVVASTTRRFEVSVPLQKEVTYTVGEPVMRKSMDLFGVRIPLSLTPQPDESYRKEAVRTKLEVNGNALPITWLEESWLKQEVRAEERSKTEALKVARDEAEKKKKELQDLKVIEQQESYRIEAGALLYRLDMKCEENIALESAFYVE